MRRRRLNSEFSSHLKLLYYSKEDILRLFYLEVQIHRNQESVFVVITLQFSSLRLEGQRLDLRLPEGAEAMVRDNDQFIILVIQESGVEDQFSQFVVHLFVPIQDAVLAPVEVLDTVEEGIAGY